MSSGWVADHALIDTKASNPKEDKQFYKTEQSYFWSQVCVSTVDISVGRNGHVNMAASKKQADSRGERAERWQRRGAAIGH